MGYFSRVRKPFRFAPPILWAIAIDTVDIVSNIPAVGFYLTGVLFPLGLALDIGVDVLQTLLACIIFENTTFALLDADFLLPPPLDLYPNYTALVVLDEVFNRK